MSDCLSMREPIQLGAQDDQGDDSQGNYTIDVSFDEEEDEGPRNDGKKRRKLQVVPPNTPFNSLSIKQAINMMTNMEISSNISSSSPSDNKTYTLVKRHQTSAKSIFIMENNESSDDNTIGDKQMIIEAAKRIGKENQSRLIFSKMELASDEQQDHHYYNGSEEIEQNEDSFINSRAPPNSPIKTKNMDKEAVANLIQDADADAIDTDLVRHSKLREIQWQLRFPPAADAFRHGEEEDDR